jgi:hypothetical protein
LTASVEESAWTAVVEETALVEEPLGEEAVRSASLRPGPMFGPTWRYSALPTAWRPTPETMMVLFAQRPQERKRIEEHRRRIEEPAWVETPVSAARRPGRKMKLDALEMCLEHSPFH